MPGEPTPNAHSFPATHWTMIARAGTADRATGREALTRLLELYLPALRSHLLLAKRLSPAVVDDLLQGFVTAKMLETNLVAAADPNRGKFRTLLLTSLDRFLVSEHRKMAAVKRGADKVCPADVTKLEIADDPSHACPGLRRGWARELLAEVLRRMRSECDRCGRPDIWAVFECRLLQPLLSNAVPADYEELVRRFGYPSPTHAANALVTAKRMFQRNLREVVAEYARSEEEIETEIDDLCRLLARGGAES